MSNRNSDAWIQFWTDAVWRHMERSSCTGYLHKSLLSFRKNGNHAKNAQELPFSNLAVISLKRTRVTNHCQTKYLVSYPETRIYQFTCYY